jgi:FkbM family methyltransferase
MSTTLFQKYEAARRHICDGRGGPICETIIEKTYQSIAKPGDLLIDGGAHAGRHTVPMAFACRPTGLVYAFDVLPVQLTRLENKSRQLMLSNIRIVRKALYKESGLKKAFHVVESHPSRSGLRSKAGLETGDTKVIEVETQSLDDTFSSGEKVKFMKLDLEGGELDALLGARTVLKRSHAVICFENSAQSESVISEMFGLLNELGYLVCNILGEPISGASDGLSDIPYLMAVKQSLDTSIEAHRQRVSALLDQLMELQAGTLTNAGSIAEGPVSTRSS